MELDTGVQGPTAVGGGFGPRACLEPQRELPPGAVSRDVDKELLVARNLSPMSVFSRGCRVFGVPEH
jgi:hypothetical protein